MNNQDLIVSQIRQRLEILYQMVNELEGGGGSGDSYTKAQTDALLAQKQDTLAFEGTYDASTNKAMTKSAVSSAISTALTPYDTWETYDNQLSVPTTFTNIDTENSSISVKVNTKLRRVVGIVSIKFSTAWSGQAGGTRIARLNMEGALSLAPFSSVRVYAATSDYLVGIIKPANSTDININVYNGEIPANTTINAQIEWTY